MKRVIVRSIIGVVFLVLGLGGPLIVIPALLAPWVAVCWGARLLFGRLGIAPLWSRALAMVLFIAGLGLALTDLRARASGSPFEQIDGAKQIALSEVRVVQGVAGCPNRCVAGTVLNRGERTIAEVYLVFDYLDARGRALGGDGLVASLSPPGPLAPSARATFLYSPSASLMGIDPRFTAVKSRVSTVRFPDSSHLRRIGRWVSQAALRLDSGLVRGRSEWCTPDETQEYAKNVAVAGRLLDAGAGRYRVEGVIDNRGGLPLRAAQVRVWAEDAEGVVLGGLVDEVVKVLMPPSRRTAHALSRAI